MRGVWFAPISELGQKVLKCRPKQRCRKRGKSLPKKCRSAWVKQWRIPHINHSGWSHLQYPSRLQHASRKFSVDADNQEKSDSGRSYLQLCRFEGCCVWVCSSKLSSIHSLSVANPRLPLFWRVLDLLTHNDPWRLIDTYALYLRPICSSQTVSPFPEGDNNAKFNPLAIFASLEHELAGCLTC